MLFLSLLCTKIIEFICTQILKEDYQSATQQKKEVFQKQDVDHDTAKDCPINTTGTF